MNFNDKIPYDVRQVLRILNERGHEAYIVGGAIRNLILNKEPKDWDITTSATTDEIQEAFFKKILVGEKYGTIAVDPIGLGNYHEVTTFRCDGNYSDGRHPDQVTFTKSLEEDLKRRDFTMNAMCMGLDGNVIDYFNGYLHTLNGLVCCVGNPADRLNEDKLRALRAVRFCAQHNMCLDDDLEEEIKKISLEEISKERIQMELNKILVSNQPVMGIGLLYSTGLLMYILPALRGDKNLEHTLNMLFIVEPILELRLATLLRNVGSSPIHSAYVADEIMRKLKYSNKEREHVFKLIKFYRNDQRRDKPFLKRFINDVGKDRIDDIFKLRMADYVGSGEEFDCRVLYGFSLTCKKIIDDKEPLEIKDLAITGEDIMKTFKIKQGKQVGDILKALMEIVLDDETMNNEFNLSMKVQEMINNG